MTFPSWASPRIQQAMRLERAVRLVWESSPRWTIASSTLFVVQGFLPLVALYLTKLVVDAVATALRTPDKEAALRHVGLMVGCLGLVALLYALIDAATTLISDRHSQVVKDHMMSVLHAKAIEVDLEYYENAQYHDTLHRAQAQAPYRPRRIVHGLVQLGQSGICLLGITTLLLTFHWGLTLVLLLGMVPGIAVRLKYSKEIFDLDRTLTLKEREVDYYNSLLTGPNHVKEIRLFDLGKLFSQRSRDLRQDIRQTRFEFDSKRFFREWTTQSLAIVPVYVCYAFIAHQTVQGVITLGSLVMYYQALQRGLGSLQSISNVLSGLYEDNLFLSHLYEFLDLERKVAEPLVPQPLPSPMQHGIVFNHVSFQYATSSRRALEDVNLMIRPGEVIALVGDNGSGKTTLIKLLCRLYDPTHGTITIDGVDIREFDTAALRREISVVFQDYLQYHMTARENIWMGDVELPLRDERIIAAARLSGADGVFAGLPAGYETHLGKMLRDGEGLSIGEWQKVALARAFVRDAQLIILDEPTSALDPRAEAEVFGKFRQLIQGQSAILITHRLATVKMADRIYFLQDGRVLESGTHKELMHRNGAYADLFGIQAQAYQ